MVKSVARGVTELFLDLIVAFKNECYEGEQEWRLAVRPRSALYSAAPADDDQRFRSIIRTGSGLKHIDLYVPRKFSSSASFLCPEVPFSAVVLSPKCPAEGAEKIRRVLSENGRVDIPVAVGV